jgi:hypothetical protein
MNLKSVNDTIEKISSQIEIILRSGASKLTEMELNELIVHADSLYKYFHDKSIQEKIGLLSNEEKKEYIESAIRIHNKARNLPQSLLRLRASVKAACAWTFASFGENFEKTVPIIIKLLSKCGHDFESCGEYEKSKECFESVVGLWQTSKTSSRFQKLAPLEAQDAKLSIFNCNIALLTYYKSHLKDFDETLLKKLKSTIANAMELLPYLSFTNKMSLLSIILDIASSLAVQKSQHNEAIQLYTKCIAILGLKNSETPENGIVIQDKENRFKLRCYLSLAYLYISLE